MIRFTKVMAIYTGLYWWNFFWAIVFIHLLGILK
ncbi:hypothetical protein CLV58_12560 [Spirosoma oryzae]|uniref:Uncharacterized protein n=1 Tax=Spirosoma oryzae TaxID=1469603 RepID=A0A2T0S8P6_9BACT|nr:hypothetical protein CLV58_12560 [Spirosoma oryzae]